MIATCAGSKAKALLPSGWFRRNEKTVGTDLWFSLARCTASVAPAVSVEATLRLRLQVRGT
jgi:hypothetical protein